MPRPTDLDQRSHIVVASYNGVVLLAGQTPREELKQMAEQAASGVQRVKRVHNELQILQPSSALARSNDSWLTTKIKTQMLADNSVPGSRIKVITENGIVYLLGLVTRQEGSRATNLVRASPGYSGSSSCSNISTDRSGRYHRAPHHLIYDLQTRATARSLLLQRHQHRSASSSVESARSRTPCLARFPGHRSP